MRVPHDCCMVCKAWGECIWTVEPIRRLCVPCHTSMKEAGVL